MAQEKLWVDERHPSYKKDAERRQFARDQYTGEALDVTLSEVGKMRAQESVRNSALDDDGGIRIMDTGIPDSEGTYLKRRSQGEAIEGYQERGRISRFPSHMSALIDSGVGGVFSVEEKAVREWGEPLGDPADKDSESFRLFNDIDGTGKNWGAALIEDAQNVIVDNIVWWQADKTNPNDPTRIFQIDPNNILNWRTEDGLVVELLMQEFQLIHAGATIRNEAELKRFYVLYNLEGWTRWREDINPDNHDERELVKVGEDEWLFPFWATPDMDRRRLPFGHVGMPRNVGYQMAQDHNMLYNLLSDARWLLRIINHPRLKGKVEDAEWNNSMEALRTGMNALQGDWDYIAPSHMNAKTAYEIYEGETKHFYITNHQRMTASNIERSATEVLFNEAAGRTSFLTMLKGKIDEAENDKMFLASQLEAPGKPETWYNSRVHRSSDFKPIDLTGLIQNQANSFAAFANILPADLAAEAARMGLTDDILSRVVRTDIEVIEEQ